MRVLILIILLLPAISVAADYQAHSATALQAQYQLLLELKAEQAITDDVFNEKTAVIKQQAHNRHQLDLDNVVFASEAEQRIDRFTSTLYSLSALLLLALIAKVMSYFPVVVNETLVYIGTLISLLFFRHEYVVLVAGFALAGVLAYSINSRIKDSGNARRWTGWLLTIVLGVLAWCFDNTHFGVASAAALVYSIGFVMLLTPGMIAVGIDNARISVVLRLTVVSLLLTLMAWLVFYTTWLPAWSSLRQLMRPFELGMLTLLPLAYFTGLGYLSFFLLRRRFWARLIAELVALSSGLLVIVIALLSQLDTMFWVGTVFMLWNLLDKFYELVYKRVSFTAACTLFAVIFGSTAALIKTNMATIMPYLEFLDL